jgi:hypothetical protein
LPLPLPLPLPFTAAAALAAHTKFGCTHVSHRKPPLHQTPQGRDANQKLQRALKAQKLRERLPALAAAVRAGLQEWAESEGAPFLYDGADFNVSLWQYQSCFCLLGHLVLPRSHLAQVGVKQAARHQSSLLPAQHPPPQALLEDLEQQLQATAQEKAAKSQARRQSSAGLSGMPPTPSAAPSPGGVRAGGARTPLPKGITGRQLQGRHSIAVVRWGPRRGSQCRQ